MTGGRQAVVLGASADIGGALCKRLVADGWSVLGTYRDPASVAGLQETEGVDLTPCDVAIPSSVQDLAMVVSKLRNPWNLFISAVGRLDPIGSWEDLDFDEWERSVRDNSTGQLRVLHALLPFRDRKGAHAALFAGGGTNGPFPNYSAYCVAKIALIKMCELLHDEVGDLNAFIVGPGFLPTKIHAPTLADPAAAGENHAKTLAFYEHLDTALSPDDVYSCIRWCMANGRDVVGGRNVAAVHDPWNTDDRGVSEALRASDNAWRLRRAPLPGNGDRQIDG